MLLTGVDLGFEEDDQLLLARQMLGRRFTGRRASSKLPGSLNRCWRGHWFQPASSPQARYLTPCCPSRLVRNDRRGGGFAFGAFLQDAVKATRMTDAFPGTFTTTSESIGNTADSFIFRRLLIRWGHRSSYSLLSERRAIP